MSPPAFQYLIPLGWRERTERMAFAEKWGCGLEVAALMSGPGLNAPDERRVMEKTLRKELAEFSGPKTMHGAFLDLVLHSTDDEVAAVAASRIERDLSVAETLGCQKIVFHLGANPLIGGNGHRERVVDAHVAFWSQALKRHPDLIICLENQWETDWSLFNEIFEKVPDNRFGLCFDAAHAHVYSDYPPAAWVRNVSRHILHYHWNDNHGDRDSHMALGEGNLDWEELWDACQNCPANTITLEISENESLRQSLVFLERRSWL